MEAGRRGKEGDAGRCCPDATARVGESSQVLPQGPQSMRNSLEWVAVVEHERLFMRSDNLSPRNGVRAEPLLVVVLEASVRVVRILWRRAAKGVHLADAGGCTHESRICACRREAERREKKRSCDLAESRLRPVTSGRARTSARTELWAPGGFRYRRVRQAARPEQSKGHCR